jgi:hypothetical protein
MHDCVIIAIFVRFLTPFLLGNDVKGKRLRAGFPERVSALTGFWNEYWSAAARAGAPKIGS